MAALLNLPKPAARFAFWDREATGYVVALAVTGLEVAIAELLYQPLNTRLSMIFIAGPLICGLRWGARPGIAAAALSTLGYALYLSKEHLSGWEAVTLAFFITASLVMSTLAGRVRDSALRERRRADTVSSLLASSRELSDLDREEDIRSTLSRQIRQATGREAEIVEAAGGRLALRRTGWGRLPEVEQRYVDILLSMGAAAIARSRLSAVRAESELAARTARLQASLLSSISHDLRTPLSAMISSASSLRLFGRKLGADSRRELLEMIENEGERLNRYIGNLLSMTKLESQALGLQTEPVELEDLIGRLFEIHRRRDPEARLERIIDGPITVMADPVLLEQALSNIIDNALKYGGPTKSATVEALRLHSMVELRIWDQGRGVPADELERIFDKFYRSGESDPGAAGAGLGLSITRGLIDAMGGAVHAEAHASGGFCIVVSLPLG